MKFNVATFFWILPNAIISDFKTYFQLISKDMLVHTWKTKSYLFFLKRYRCWDMLFWKLFGFEVRKFRSVCGKLKVTISKLSGECSTKAKYFQQNKRDGVYEVTSYQLSNFATRKWNLLITHFRSMFPFYTPWQRLK